MFINVTAIQMGSESMTLSCTGNNAVILDPVEIRKPPVFLLVLCLFLDWKFIFGQDEIGIGFYQRHCRYGAIPGGTSHCGC
jgi:hypothetical protein